MSLDRLEPEFGGQQRTALLLLGLIRLTGRVVATLPIADGALPAIPAPAGRPPPLEAFLLGVVACHELLTGLAPEAGGTDGGPTSGGPVGAPAATDDRSDRSPPGGRHDGGQRWLR